MPWANRELAGTYLPCAAMNRAHGLVLAVAIGLAAAAGTYAALQTTDLGAKASTLSQQQVTAANARLDKRQAALRHAAAKHPPRLPKLPHKISAPAPAPAAAPAAAPAPAPTPAIATAPAPPTGSYGSGPTGDAGPGGWADDRGDDRSDNESSGHSEGGEEPSDDGGGDD